MAMLITFLIFILLNLQSTLKDVNQSFIFSFLQAGDGISLEYLFKPREVELTSVEADNPWFKAFKCAMEKSNVKISTLVFPAGTDANYIREVGIPAFGFSPMNHTPILLHDTNEFLNEKVFLKGIDIFCNVITEIASV